MSYARYTEIDYDPAKREEVLAYWSAPDTAKPQERPGFIRGFILDSEETLGKLRIVTIWESPEHFNAHFKSPAHLKVVPALAQLSAKIVDRDGLNTEALYASPAEKDRDEAGHIRIIRSRILNQARNDELRDWWRAEGRDALESADGVHASRAYIDETAGLFVIQVWWESVEKANLFVSSDEHEEQLTVPLNEWVQKIDRVDGDPID